jgi:hypothetical protein
MREWLKQVFSNLDIKEFIAVAIFSGILLLKERFQRSIYKKGGKPNGKENDEA